MTSIFTFKKIIFLIIKGDHLDTLYNNKTIGWVWKILLVNI
nr:MAG TPA: hypothetical protein [Bacteriophage sp.]